MTITKEKQRNQQTPDISAITGENSSDYSSDPQQTDSLSK